MALHSKDTFIKQYSPSDTLIIIQDVDDNVTYEIKPWNVNSMYVRPAGKSIIIKQKGSDYNPVITFDTYSEALGALTNLQMSIDLMKGVVDNIPDEIKNYIDNQILSVIESGKFVFRQSTTSDSWDILEHGMDKKPSVMILNNDLEVIEGYIKYIDDDNIEVGFNIPISGWILLN